MSEQNVIQIAPLHYIHILDKNSTITRLVGPGPLTFIRQEHEQLILPPTKMIVLNSLQFCEITNPIQVDPETKEPVQTTFGQIKNKFGEKEIRSYEEYKEPFVLYPGEVLSQKPSDQTIVLANQALKLKKIRDSLDGRKAGEIFQLVGPFVYVPKVDEIIVEKVNSSVIRVNEALKLLALQDLIDSNGVKRKAGEKWLVRQVGEYLPGVFEKIQATVTAQILTDLVALNLRTKKTFIDVYGITRKAGEEWLVTNKMAQTHIIDVNEELVQLSQAIVLSSIQHCVILNPYDQKAKTNLWGSKILKKGECIFFLEPFEEIVSGQVQENIILGEDEALLLIAQEEFTDEQGKIKLPGEKWMVRGPREFITPIQVNILERRSAIPLNEDEGVYVRNNVTGEVQKFMGQTVMLEEYESLWEKELPPQVEELLMEQQQGKPFIPQQFQQQKQQALSYQRDKTKVIQYQVEKNRVVQLFNYKTKETRIIFGPALAILEPDEQFTVLNLSGGRPKVENVSKSLSLSLGPDFMTDILIVETSDHAQLSIQLVYNWQFIIDKTNLEEQSKLFSVKDFIGGFNYFYNTQFNLFFQDACKQIASRVRGAVSQIPFEIFHRNSAQQIQQAVFGKDSEGQLRKLVHFKTNNLRITSVDIQNVEITDPQTREYLQRSINLAIEISTKSQEDKSKFQAKQLDEQAKGQLQLQSLEYQAECEQQKIKLYELEALCNAVKLQGEASALAKADQRKLQILGEGQVNIADLETKAKQIMWQNDIELLKRKQLDEYTYQKEKAELEIKKSRELANIEINKLTEIIGAIGQDTIVAISKAGPEMKAKLLKGLGLKGYLVTDGKNPINLFNTANGFMGQVENNA